MSEKVCRKRSLTEELRFEFTIPPDVPKDKIDVYANERLKKICEKLNRINGLTVVHIKK